MKTLRSSSFVVLAIAAFTSAAGCAGSRRLPPQTPGEQVRVTNADVTDIAPRTEHATSLSVPTALEGTRPKETAGTPSPVADPTGASVPKRAVTDAQIAVILQAVIDGELTEARLAAKRTKNARVEALATRIASDQGAAGASLTEFEGRHPLAPDGAPASTKIGEDRKAQNAADLSTLRAAHGAQLDGTYVDERIAETARLLELLDGTLIPNAEDPELRTQLANVRAMIDAHAKLARETQSTYREHGVRSVP